MLSIISTFQLEMLVDTSTVTIKSNAAKSDSTIGEEQDSKKRGYCGKPRHIRTHARNFMVIQHVVHVDKYLVVHGLKITCLKLLILSCQEK